MDITPCAIRTSAGSRTDWLWGSEQRMYPQEDSDDEDMQDYEEDIMNMRNNIEDYPMSRNMRPRTLEDSEEEEEYYRPEDNRNLRTVVEEEEDTEEPSRDLSKLSWKEFFGSSVDLMSLYDTITHPDTVSAASAAMAAVAPPSSQTGCSVLNDADAKKRPLSVSSTSSSSSSSLPRQPRKKVAAGSTIEEWKDDQHDINCHRNHHHSNHTDIVHPMDGISSPSKHCENTATCIGATLLAKVVAEIIETEKKYVDDLRDIIEGYLQYTIDEQDDLDIPQEDITALFGNVTDIYEFNSGFQSGLEQCGTDPIRVAECFVNKGQGFLIYADYCTNYPRAVEVLTKCMRDPKLADAFKHQQMALQHGLPLGSYLLKPVQRILKYHLLLQNMLNNYDLTKLGHNVIHKALESMTKMANTINEMKRKHERMVHVQEIQSLLYGWEGDDLTTFGDLVLEDSFRMYGAKAHRLLFLFEKGLFIAKRKEDGIMAPKDSILCSNLMLIESIPKEPLSFHVIPFDNPRLQYTVQAKNLEQKRAWCQELKRLILENYSAEIPEKAKELVMMLGKSRDEEGLDASRIENMDPAKKQHSAPEYLERRRGRRKSTSLIPDFGLLKAKRGTRKSPRLHRRTDMHSFSSMAHSSPSKSKLHDLSCQESHLEEEPEIIAEQVDAVTRTPLSEHGCQNRMTRSQSRSLESLRDAIIMSASAISTQSNSPCQNEEELRSQLSGNGATLNLSILNVPAKNERNIDITPLDCRTVTNIRRKYIKQASAPTLPYCDENSPDRDINDSPDLRSRSPMLNNTSVQGIDDGYVNVVFSSRVGFTIAEECEEPDSIYSNLVHVRNAVDNSHSRGGSSEDGYGNYVKLDLTATSPSRTQSLLPDVVSSHCTNERTVYPSQSVMEVLTPTSSVSSSPIPSRCAYSIDSHNSDQGANTDQSRRHLYTADSIISSCTSLETLKAGGIINPAFRDTSFVDGARVLSVQGLIDSSIPCESDPWVPRTPEHCASPELAISNSAINSVTVHKQPEPCEKSKKKDKSKKDGKLVRSNSFTSTDDLKKKCLAEEEIFIKGHRRQTSDTLIFSDRCPFLASSLTKDIRRDCDLQQRIVRLATPPRELGPEDLLEEIQLSKERGRIVARYATPPRQIMDPSYVKKIGASAHMGEESIMGNNIMESSRISAAPNVTTSPGSSSRGRSPATRGPSSAISCDGLPPQSGVWYDMSAGRTSTPRSSTHINPQRSGSFHGRSVHSASTRGRSLFSPHSPTSPTSSESIVDSLKNVVMNITSKLTRRSHGPASPKSVDSSPVRSLRARSVEDMHRIDRSPDQRGSAKSSKDKRKDKKHKFVYQLARAYSERVKGKPRHQKPDSNVKRELKELLRENKPGSLTLGERIATSKPVVLGTYTLPRHRPQRPKKVSTSQTLEAETSPCDTQLLEDETTLEGKMSPPLIHSEDTFKLNQDLLTILQGSDEALDNSGSEETDDCASEFFYEQRFVEDLEGCLDSSQDIYFDSTGYSDDCAMSYVDPDAASCLQVSIRDTVRLIEHRHKSKHVPKIEVKQKEKAMGIRDLVKTLEAASSSSSTPGTPDISPENMSEPFLFKTVRERTRELVECATLTRIRQDSYCIADDYVLPSAGESEEDSSSLSEKYCITEKGTLKSP